MRGELLPACPSAVATERTPGIKKGWRFILPSMKVDNEAIHGANHINVGGGQPFPVCSPSDFLEVESGTYKNGQQDFTPCLLSKLPMNPPLTHMLNSYIQYVLN